MHITHGSPLIPVLASYPSGIMALEPHGVSLINMFYESVTGLNILT